MARRQRGRFCTVCKAVFTESECPVCAKAPATVKAQPLGAALGLPDPNQKWVGRPAWLPLPQIRDAEIAELVKLDPREVY